MRKAVEIQLTEKECKTLEKWARGRRTPVRLMIRSKIILLAANGKPNNEIALELGVSRKMVGLWRTRFAEKRFAGIEKDAPRGGRKPVKREKLARAILEKNDERKAEGCNALECENFGQGNGDQRLHGSSSVASEPLETALSQYVQSK